MAQTKLILVSLHGRKCGLSQDGKIVVNGFTTPRINDAGAHFGVQATPGALDVTGPLTAALITGAIVTSTTAAAVAATLDTGTVLDAALTAAGTPMAVNDSFDWVAINTGGVNTFTVTAAATHTIVGSGVVALGTSATFRTRKTAANTFVTYRR